jgi:hypothetical protein
MTDLKWDAELPLGLLSFQKAYKRVQLIMATNITTINANKTQYYNFTSHYLNIPL